MAFHFWGWAILRHQSGMRKVHTRMCALEHSRNIFIFLALCCSQDTSTPLRQDMRGSMGYFIIMSSILWILVRDTESTDMRKARHILIRGGNSVHVRRKKLGTSRGRLESKF
jgi:hypothetical protein